jgi:DNA-binding HxlR family transcriptional regulator
LFKINDLEMKKSEKKICPVSHALSIIGGKWKIVVISTLVSKGTLRFKELEREIAEITPKMLIKVLKELEDEKLVARKVFAEVPPRVEYSITPLGLTLNALITEIHAWGEYHLANN